jgi:ribosomal protein S18 acetylase RimI-like enzyme
MFEVLRSVRPTIPPKVVRSNSHDYVDATSCSSRALRTLCDWISQTGELGLISGESGSVLQISVIEKWIEEALAAFVVFQKALPIAFGAVSQRQAPLPANAVEIVHTIVHPYFRRRGVGTELTRVRMKAAADKGYERAFFRVLPTNFPRQRLLSKMGISPSSTQILPGFHWYETDISHAIS